MLAMAVTSTIPTAWPIFAGETISLMMPCLAGEKMAHCVPSRKSPQTASQRKWKISATSKIDMMANCAHIVSTTTSRLAKRSAIQPASGAKSTKGSRMSAASTVLISLA